MIIFSKATPIKQRLQNVMFAIDLPCDRSLDLMWQTVERLTHFSRSYRSWRRDFSLPVLRQTVMIDTFFAFRSFLVEEQNFQLPLSVRSLLTWCARVKRSPLVTVKIRVAGLSCARNEETQRKSSNRVENKKRKTAPWRAFSLGIWSYHDPRGIQAASGCTNNSVIMLKCPVRTAS